MTSTLLFTLFVSIPYSLSTSYIAFTESKEFANLNKSYPFKFFPNARTLAHHIGGTQSVQKSEICTSNNFNAVSNFANSSILTSPSPPIITFSTKFFLKKNHIQFSQSIISFR